MFQKDLRLSLLLDFYGDLLSPRKQELIALYYDEDFSLSEIAEHTGISRQGVRDSIKRSEQELFHLEETLGLVGRFETLQKQLGEISKALNALAENNAQVRAPLQKIVEKLEHLSI